MLDPASTIRRAKWGRGACTLPLLLPSQVARRITRPPPSPQTIPLCHKDIFCSKSSLLARPLFSLYFRSSHREFPCCGTICSRSRLRQGLRPPGFNRASDKSGWLELAGLTGDYISPRFPTTSKLENKQRETCVKSLSRERSRQWRNICVRLKLVTQSVKLTIALSPCCRRGGCNHSAWSLPGRQISPPERSYHHLFKEARAEKLGQCR